MRELAAREAAPGVDPGMDRALVGLIGVASLQQSAVLAGVSGFLLLAVCALLSGLGLAADDLGPEWLIAAVSMAALAAVGGPMLGAQVLSRHLVTRWRLILFGLMTANSTIWIFAAAVGMADAVVSDWFMMATMLAICASLLPMVNWLPGLVLLLSSQFALIAWFASVAGYTPEQLVAPVGIWCCIAGFGLTAAFHARRSDRTRGEAHCLRFESSDLQSKLDAAEQRLLLADRQRGELEAELSEILDLAEVASRTKTEFLATMSHEIRTPLNGILPILEMLRETRLDDEQRRMVHTAQGSSRHLLRIINDILDFAKVESGKLQLETIEIEVRELVASVVELMQGSARNRGLRLSASINDNVPKVVRGDPIRLRQILINLVSNAVKFTEEGGIRVEVARGQTSQKEVELLFAVADTGMGMSQETVERLFDAFTQADASTTRKHGGTGLGLVICRRLVELMGGKIGVRTSPGQGSTFWFLVPLRKSVMEVPSARRDLDGVRILSLIPDPEVAAMVSANLRAWGVVEQTSQDPVDALGKLRATSELGQSWTCELLLVDATGIEGRLPAMFAEIHAVDSLRQMQVLVAVRSESIAHKLKRDYGVMILGDAMRIEPLRRVLYRVFDVESQRYGSLDLRMNEIYADLNVPVDRLELEQRVEARRDGEFAGRILLVEDNPVNLSVVLKALSGLGLSCQTATDGIEALTLFGRERFDLIFMDCQMPQMDGYEATRQIRRLETIQGLAPTPVIAMTANAMAGDREKCLTAGMDDYLAKPVALQQLRDCVANWMIKADRKGGEEPEQVAELVANETAGDPALLDQRVLRELREIMDDDYIGLLKTYLSNSPRLMAEARAAIARSNIDALLNPVHSLKSSSANVGAMQLSVLAKQAEHLVRNGDFSGAQRVFAELEQVFDATELALQRHVALYSA